MTIDKALEIKLQWRKNGYPPPLADETNADMMSIEALNRLKWYREYPGSVDDTPLPGEEPQ